MWYFCHEVIRRTSSFSVQMTAICDSNKLAPHWQMGLLRHVSAACILSLVTRRDRDDVKTRWKHIETLPKNQTCSIHKIRSKIAQDAFKTPRDGLGAFRGPHPAHRGDSLKSRLRRLRVDLASVTQAPWRGSTFKPINSAWGKKRSAFVTALPQIRVETLIGSQANYEIKIKITIYFYKITISYEKYSTFKLQ